MRLNRDNRDNRRNRENRRNRDNRENRVASEREPFTFTDISASATSSLPPSFLPRRIVRARRHRVAGENHTEHEDN